MREEQLAFRARDPDVEETPFFLEHGRILERLRERKESVLQARDEDDGELEPLGIVQRHHGDGIRIGAKLVELRHEHGLLEKMVERRESDLAFLIRHQLGRARDQFLHVLEAIRAFGSFRLEVLVVPRAFDHFAQQLVDPRLACRFAKARNQRGELRQRPASGWPDRREQVRAHGGGEHWHAGFARRK